MKKKDKQLLIFDIDGVLVDVTHSYREAAKQTAEFFTKKEVKLEEIQEYKNKGGFINDWNLTEAVIRGKGYDVGKKKIIEKFQQHYSELKKNEKWILDKKILKGLKKSYKLAVFTGRPRSEAIEVLQRFNVLSCFNEIVAMEDVKKEKPSPEGLLKILKKCNVGNALYFGDTIDDAKAAINADIIAVGVLPPTDKSDKLKNMLLKNGAKYVLSNINEIWSVLK